MEVRHRVAPRDDPPSRVVTVGGALIGAASGVLFAASLLLGAPLEVYGSAIAIGAFALAFALRRVAVSTYPYIQATEQRHGLPPSEGPIAAIQPVARRPLLRGVLWLGAGTFLASLLAPVAALGPRRAQPQADSPWEGGLRLTDGQGRHLRPEHLPAGGFVTVWPQGVARDELAAVVVLRLTGSAQSPTDLGWVVDGNLVAYSKICTHMGCPVGLYRERDNVLFCPCHQAQFDASRGARPYFGPASRALPQLPLGVDSDGYLVALGDFVDEVGSPPG